MRYIWHLNALVIIVLFTEPFTSFSISLIMSYSVCARVCICALYVVVLFHLSVIILLLVCALLMVCLHISVGCLSSSAGFGYFDRHRPHVTQKMVLGV